MWYDAYIGLLGLTAEEAVSFSVSSPEAQWFIHRHSEVNKKAGLFLSISLVVQPTRGYCR